MYHREHPHRIFLRRIAPGSFCVLCMTFISLSMGADYKPPKGDLSPPVRVRWAEPGDQLVEESIETPPPAPKKKKEPPPPVEEIPYVITNGYGSMGRASHLIGKTFGRNDSMTPLEVMPYLLTDEHFVFADARGFVTNRSEGGGNFGLGYRRLMDNWNAWGGASVWYDADQSTGKMFQQIGLSFEGLINQWEFRSNVYLPLTSSQTFSNSVTGSTIVGNQLLYTRTTDLGTSLQGVDFEGGYSLPVLDRHVVRGFVGGYHFENGTAGSVNGFRARAEAVINYAVTAQVMFTHDRLYGDNVMVGLSLQYPFGKNHPTTGWDRNTPSPFRFVERNYNVIVAQANSAAPNQVATDPQTGNPYVVDQVYSPGSGSTPVLGIEDGTTANPYSSISAAQAAGANVIIVRSGSVITDAITLAPGQHLFGQTGSPQSLPTSGGGTVMIPNLGAPSLLPVFNTTPVIDGISGSAITLASNSEVAGFLISGSTGSAITGTGVSGVSLHDLMFTSIGGDAINLSNSSGNVYIANTQINSVASNGIVLTGGSPTLSYNGQASTITTQGDGFVLRDLTGGSINLTNLNVMKAGGTGLVLDHAAANASIDSLIVSNAASNAPNASAVEITGATGSTVNFNGTTQITASNGYGFNVNTTDAKVNVNSLNITSTSGLPAVTVTNTSNPVTIGNLSVTTQNTTGLSASNVTGLQIGSGSITTVNAPAIDVQSAGFNAKLGSVSVDGGAFGVRILNSAGAFTITGSGNTGSGGTIQNTTSAGLLISSYGSTSVNWVNFVNNNVGIQSTGTSSLSMTHLQITGSTGYAIDSLNDQTFILGSSVLSGNGSSSGGSVREQATNAATYNSTLNYNTITDSNGIAFQLVNQSAAVGSTLNLTFNTNTFSGYANNAAITSVNWSGPVTANYTSNIVNAFGTGMTGILLQDPSTTSKLTATFTANTVNFASGADSGNGIWIVNGQPGQTSTIQSALIMNGNVVDLQGKQGTGLRFGLYDAGVVSLTSNSVTDHVGGVTGVLYDYLAGGSNLTSTGNKITFLQGDSLPARSFVYAQGSPTVTLNYQQGSATNWVYNTQDSTAGFSMQSGFGTGGIVINNKYFAAPQ